MKTEKKHRVYLYEVDLMRCFFMLAVLATHVTSHYTDAFVNGSHSHELMLASHMMLHFARYGFMFLVLFLVYYNSFEEVLDKTYRQYWYPLRILDGSFPFHYHVVIP